MRVISYLVNIIRNMKKVTSVGTIKTDDEDMNGIIEEVHRRYKFDLGINIGVISECEYDDESSNNEERINEEEYDEL